jgi:hypothetical protein
MGAPHTTFTDEWPGPDGSGLRLRAARLHEMAAADGRRQIALVVTVAQA